MKNGKINKQGKIQELQKENVYQFSIIIKFRNINDDEDTLVSKIQEEFKLLDMIIINKNKVRLLILLF